MRKVVLVYGPPCAGKSTYVNERVQATDVVLDLDVMAQQAGSPRPWLHDAYHARMAQQEWRQRASEIAGQPSVRAWLIRCAPRLQERRHLGRLARVTDAVLLLPDEQTLTSRAWQRPNPQRTLAAIATWRAAYIPDVGVGTTGLVPRANGHRYRKARRAVLDASDLCWWCGHPGADEADHVVARSVDPGQDVADPAGMAPIHGVHGCPYCPLVDGKSRKCNQQRGAATSTQSTNVRRSISW